MLRRPKLRAPPPDEDGGKSEVKMARVSAAVIADVVTRTDGEGEGGWRRGSGRERGFTVRGEDARKRVGRFLAKLDATKIDSASIKEQLERARERTSAVLKDIKVPKVEDLKNLIDDIREEQTLAQYHPDRKRLSSVADFFSYTEEEGTSCVSILRASSCAIDVLKVCRMREVPLLTRVFFQPPQVESFLKKWIARGKRNSRWRT